MNKLFYCSFIFLAVGCKEIYISPAKPTDTGYLVVEGIINSGAGPTTIKLSRSANLNDKNIYPEPNAQVRVEGDDHLFYPLFEANPGQYSTSDLNLVSGINYRINIRTSDGKEYFSDFAKVKNNPPIDSISWKKERDGLQLYIHTHDPMDTTRYYQWEYVETWEFHSRYDAVLKYYYDSFGIITGIGYRNPLTHYPDTTIYRCWQSEASSSIKIGSSAKLGKDEIYLPLTFIPPGSWKLSVLYSIDVRQYSQNKDGYEFLERMKKNTEGTGSVFDAQPSELNGNIHCVTNPSEPVIGYVTICPIQEKRFFISNGQVPGWVYDSGCPSMLIKTKDIGFMSDSWAPAYPTVIDLLMGITEFRASFPYCIDCTLKGSNVKPLFWP